MERESFTLQKSLILQAFFVGQIVEIIALEVHGKEYQNMGTPNIP